MATKSICILFIFLLLLQGFSCQLLLTPRKIKVEVFYSPVDKKIFDVMETIEKILETDLGRFMYMEVNNVENCALYQRRNKTKMQCFSESETGQREAYLVEEQLCAYYSLIDVKYCGHGVQQHSRLQRYMLQGIRYIICTSDMNRDAGQNVARCRPKIPKVKEDLQKCRKRNGEKEIRRAFARHEEICLDNLIQKYPVIILNNMWDWRLHENVKNMKYLGYFICDLLFNAHEVCKRKYNKKPETMLGVDEDDDSSSTSLSTQTYTRLGYLLAMTLTIFFLR